MDISVIIAHREAEECKASAYPMGLWMSMQSIIQDLKDSGFTYEFSIVTTGLKTLHSDTTNALHFVQKYGVIGYVEHFAEVLAPPVARQKAIDKAKGKYLFIFDNHIMVPPGYFKRAIESMEKYNMDSLHSVTRFFFGENDCYEYNLRLDKNFWGEATFEPKSQEPYRIAVAGHGGFVVRRDVFEEVGGYNWDGWDGYGGEETYFDLKLWLLGKNNWIDPKLLHYHYAGNRGYKRHYTDEFFINMMAIANIIGGEDWMYKVQASFATNYMKVNTGRSIFDLMMIAQEKSKEHSAWLASKRKMTLDELLAYFTANNIAY